MDNFEKLLEDQEKQMLWNFVNKANYYVEYREALIKQLSSMYINDKNCSFLKNKAFISCIKKYEPLERLVNYYVKKFKEKPPYFDI